MTSRDRVHGNANRLAAPAAIEPLSEDEERFVVDMETVWDGDDSVPCRLCAIIRRRFPRPAAPAVKVESDSFEAARSMVRPR